MWKKSFPVLRKVADNFIHNFSNHSDEIFNAATFLHYDQNWIQSADHKSEYLQNLKQTAASKLQIFCKKTFLNFSI